MSACEQCWANAFRVSRMTGRPQVEVYYEELAKMEPHPRDGDVPMWTGPHHECG